MEKSLTIILIFILFEIQGFSQRIYSQENLISSTQDDLSFYLSKAQTQRKTGAVLVIISPISLITGSILTRYSWSGGSYFLGMGMILASVPLAAIGLPVWIVGGSRIERVSEIYNSRYSSVRLDFAVCRVNNFQAQNIHPGLSLRINF